MKLLVTAFGPFGGRSCNASSLALLELKRRLPWINTRVFPVDSIIAPLRMNRALREVKPRAVILLGEAAGAFDIRLETTAWNELDFRIPDTADRQPRQQCIVEHAPDSLPSTLPLDRIHDRLKHAGHAVSLSHDPGRYLCNQMLFHTLWRTGMSRDPVSAGFIHLPLEHDFPTTHAVAALESVVEVLRVES
jgi:pyroglutamyl-peptidase